MCTPVRARGYVPIEGMHSLIVEIAPALAIHRIIDLALKSVPKTEPGILFVERQFAFWNSTVATLATSSRRAKRFSPGSEPRQRIN